MHFSFSYESLKVRKCRVLMRSAERLHQDAVPACLTLMLPSHGRKYISFLPTAKWGQGFQHLQQKEP